MKEEYLHYLFRFKLLGSQFKTVDGNQLEILNFGIYNTNAGPDFLEGKIKLNGQIWSGPIEFHVKSSDWFLHKHQLDKRYDNVIAHFVFEHDAEVKAGQYNLPTVELKSKIDFAHFGRYQDLAESKKTIPCQSQISEVDPFLIFQQKERALTNRIFRKSQIILEDIKRLNGDHEKAFYLSLARTFGGKVNADSFEKLVELIDLKKLQKWCEDESAIASMLFGVAGLLPNESSDNYVNELKTEFNFQKHKLNLKQLNASEWKYSRMYAHGFPTIRLAQFSELIKKKIPLSQLISCELSMKKIQVLFSVTPHEFWKTHYRFETTTKIKSTNLSKDFKSLIVINTIVPFLFAIGILNDDELLKEKALNYLNEIEPEKNGVIESWANLGIESESAFDTQALIEQKNEFCSKKKCLFCTIGTKLLKHEHLSKNHLVL